jgi:hypothetical protein
MGAIGAAGSVGDVTTEVGGAGSATVVSTGSVETTPAAVGTVLDCDD